MDHIWKNYLIVIGVIRLVCSTLQVRLELWISNGSIVIGFYIVLFSWLFPFDAPFLAVCFRVDVPQVVFIGVHTWDGIRWVIVGAAHAGPCNPLSVPHSVSLRLLFRHIYFYKLILNLIGYVKVNQFIDIET